MLNKAWMWIGTFSIIMMLYLFLAPKLVKKPAGTPPRSGSNKEQMMIQQVAAGAPPAAAMGTATAGGFGYQMPSSPGFGAGGNALGIIPEGARGPTQPGLSFGGASTGSFKLGGAFRAARRRGRAFRGIRSRSPNLNLFPFASVSLA